VPTYQYVCTECSTPLEAVQKFTDDALTVCPTCGGKLRKVFSSVGVVFKGSGFYRTDSRSDSKTRADAGGSGSASSASSDSGSSSSSGSDSGSGSGSGDSGSSASKPAAESKSGESGASAKPSADAKPSVTPKSDGGKTPAKTAAST
jgi:putative FmdB family regulatory protein